MPHGYNGKILHVNLSTGAIEVEQPSEAFYRKYMGGSAMGAYYLLKKTKPGIDPLSPDNVLCLMASVITGVAISGQSRMTATAKSPLTDCIGDAQGGGFFPAEFKFAGYDGLVIEGKAENPVYLWIKDGEVELRDANHLWGKITGDAEAMIKKELGDDKIEVAQIGPAGENLVRFAAIMTMSNRAFGRTGMGAVMGSKNLKAIAVRGTQKMTVANKKAIGALTRWGVKAYPDSDVAGLGKYGTAETVSYQQRSGGLPTYNFNSGVFDGYEGITGELLYDKYLRGAEEGKQNILGRDTCYACTVRCKRVAEWTKGPYNADPHYGGPEYETIATFGSYCGVGEMEPILYANELCNRYGMDTISCGATIAWAFEAYEAGALSKADTEGLELTYGNANAMVRLTEMIATREGFGAVLAEGSCRAAQVIGKGTDAFLITSKKQETPAHMPQAKPSLGLIYALNPFGSDHQSSEHDPSYREYPERMAQIGLSTPVRTREMNREKVEFALKTQYTYSATDSVNVCQFVWGPAWHLYDVAQLAQAVSHITGWNVTVDELQTLGQRRLNLLRAYNAREGIGKEEDMLPEKMFKKALKGGRSDGRKIDHAEWLAHREMYYEMAGWDVETGNPTPETLDALGLAWIAETR